MIRLTPEQRAMLKALQRARDEYATMLGVATAEYEVAKITFFNHLKASTNRQAEVGEEILKSFGLDPKGDYIICLHGYTPGIKEEEDGVVKKLVSGNYVEVEASK